MSRVRLLPLGGLGEIGMNCLAIEQDGQALVVDCGVAFDPRGLGVDVIHPDFAALDELRVAGVFITHGHEDHIGAVPYLLRRIDAPVYGPSYALGLVRERSAEHEILDHVDLRVVAPRQRVKVGPFEVEPIRVTHSIADATALAIRTAAGLVVHTGDFKFDEAPPDGEEVDEERFRELGKEGVRLLLSDSTNVDSAGPTGSEEGVGRTLDELVGAAPQAVVVGVFASNIHRLRMLGDIARRHGRKLVPLGRSVSTHSRVARSTARSTGPHAGRPYLEWPSDLVWPANRVGELPRRAILGIATGSQGEDGAALARLGRGEHPALTLVEGDTVILSSRAIPGNEPQVMHVIANLLRRGILLRTWWSDRGLHVSGHAHRQEQQRMIDLVEPQSFVPVHGTLHHLVRHAEVAREKGVEGVCVLENGDVGELDAGATTVRKAGQVRAGRVHVYAKRPLPPAVLHDRAVLAANGVAHVVVSLDGRGRPSGDVTLVTRGVVDDTIDAHTLAAARNEVYEALELLSSEKQPSDAEAADVARLAVRRALGRTLGFKPVTTTAVLRIRGE